MLESNSREMGDQPLLEAPQSDPAAACGTGKPYGPARDEPVRLRSPARQERSLACRPGPQLPPDVDLELWPQDRNADDEARKSWFRRHPLRGINATLGFVAFVTLSAHAAPEVQTKGSPVELGVAPFIELVRDDCGYAYHRTLWQDEWGNWYWGRCVPNWWGNGAFLPPD